MISFGRVSLSPLVEHRLALPPMPRAQLAFWPTLSLTLDSPPPRRRRRLERFREWLGSDPRKMDPDDLAAHALAFNRATRRRSRAVTPNQPDLPNCARRVAKPRSLGFVPTGLERRGWEPKVRLPVFPSSRGDCPETRPCTFIRCRYHLKLEIDEDTARRLPEGNSALIKDLFPAYAKRIGRDGVERERYVYPGMGLEDMPHTCALDVAAEGPHTLDQVGAALSVSLERVRQMSELALGELRAKLNGHLEERGTEVTREELLAILRRLGLESTFV